MATSFRPTLAATSAPMRGSQARTSRAPAAKACPVTATTVGCGWAYRRISSSPPDRTSSTMPSAPPVITDRSKPADRALPLPTMHRAVASAVAASSASWSWPRTATLRALALPSSIRTTATPSSTVVVTASLIEECLLRSGELHHGHAQHGHAEAGYHGQFEARGQAVAAPRHAGVEGVRQAGRNYDVVEHRPSHGIDGVGHGVDLGQDGQPPGQAVEREHGAR